MERKHEERMFHLLDPKKGGVLKEVVPERFKEFEGTHTQNTCFSMLMGSRFLVAKVSR